MSTTKPASPTRWSGQLWGLLLVLSGNMLIDALEVSIAVVALPSIGADLVLPVSALHGTITGFAVGFGGLLLVGGRVVLLLGRRRVYLLALVGFAGASVAGALASDATVFIATRFITGFCVALTAPTGLAIIGSTFADGPARRRAVAVYSLFGASGFSTGLLLAGAVTALSWRWAFLLPAPMAIVLCVAGLWLIPRDDPAAGHARRYDIAGAAAVIGFAVLVPAAITIGAGAGWAHPGAIGALGGAVVLAVVFVRVELAAADPLLRIGVLSSRPLVRSVLGAAALNGSYWGFLYVVTLHLQGPAGWSPLQTALAILPAALLPVLAAPIAARLAERIGTARLIAVGAPAPPAGYALFLGTVWSGGGTAAVLPAMVLVGTGFALSFAALHVQALSGALPAELGMASGGYQTAVQLGGAIVLAATAGFLAVDQHGALIFIIAVGVGGLAVALTGVVKRGQHHIAEVR